MPEATEKRPRLAGKDRETIVRFAIGNIAQFVFGVSAPSLKAGDGHARLGAATSNGAPGARIMQSPGELQTRLARTLLGKRLDPSPFGSLLWPYG
jgi:hypothetical protein